MNKFLLAVALGFSMLPAISFAQMQGDVNPNASTSCDSVTHNLSYRSKDNTTGGDVSTLQDFLQTKGFLNSEPTGYFGLLTQTAVRKFQSVNNILSTGYVGPITREKIKNQICSNQTNPGVGVATTSQSVISLPTPTPSPAVSTGTITTTIQLGSAGVDVTNLQQFLVAKGFLTMPAGVAMGYFDQLTKDSLISFQKASNLSPADGVVGPMTRSVINSQTTLVSTSPINSPISSQYKYKLESSAIPSDKASTTYLPIQYRTKFDSNKADPFSVALQLYCPQGVSAMISGESIERCNTLVPMRAMVGDNGDYRISVNFKNNTSSIQLVGSGLFINGLGVDKDALSVPVFYPYMNPPTTTTTPPALTIPVSVDTSSTNKLTVTSPNSGSYAIGTPILITWSGTVFDDGVSINLTEANPNTIGGIIGQVLNGQQSFLWDGKTQCNGFNNGVGFDCGVVKAGVHRVKLAGNMKTGAYSLTEGSNFTMTGGTLPVATTPVLPTESLGTPPADSASTNTSCPQSTTINGTTYTLSPCSIDLTMTDGQGNKNFSTTIMASGGNSSSYSYNTYGYGVGFPTYGILGGSSGGAVGNTPLNLYFNDAYLSSNGSQPKKYTGYLPIKVYQGSAAGGNGSYLNLNVNLTVNPAK